MSEEKNTSGHRDVIRKHGKEISPMDRASHMHVEQGSSHPHRTGTLKQTEFSQRSRHPLSMPCQFPSSWHAYAYVSYVTCAPLESIEI